MAGPSVAVRILGDLTGWSKSVSGTADTAQAGASRIKGAFSSVLGQLNKTGVLGPFGSTLDQVSSLLDGLGKKAASNSEKMIAGGGAMLALGVGIQALGSKEVEAQNALATAIKNTGKTYDQYTTQINAAVKAEEKHGETADETMTALQRLTQATHSPTEALKLLAEAIRPRRSQTRGPRLGGVGVGQGLQREHEAAQGIRDHGQGDDRSRQGARDGDESLAKSGYGARRCERETDLRTGAVDPVDDDKYLGDAPPRHGVALTLRTRRPSSPRNTAPSRRHITP